MIIELHPKLEDILIHVNNNGNNNGNNCDRNKLLSELYYKLENYNKENMHMNKFIIYRNNYTDFFCEDGIYTIMNDELCRSQYYNLYKKGINNPIKMIIKTTSGVDNIELYANYIENKDNITQQHYNITYLNYNNVSERRTKFTIMIANNSNTRCNLIFNEKKELIDIYVITDLPILNNTPNYDEHNIEYVIRNCIENNETILTNVYNEDIYSLFLIIRNIT
jgi:hypothetical protein